jgi:hypothetical protein
MVASVPVQDRAGAAPRAAEVSGNAPRDPDRAGIPAARGRGAHPSMAEHAVVGKGASRPIQARGLTGQADEVAAPPPSREAAASALPGERAAAPEPAGQRAPLRAVAEGRETPPGIVGSRPGTTPAAAERAVQSGEYRPDAGWVSGRAERPADAAYAYTATAIEAPRRAAVAALAGGAGASPTPAAASTAQPAAIASDVTVAAGAGGISVWALAEAETGEGDPRGGSLGAPLAASGSGGTGPGASAAGPGQGSMAGGGQASALAQQVGQQLGEAMRAGAGGGRLDVTLQPEDLGRMRLVFTPTDSGLTVSVSAERPETLDLLRRNIDLLARDLAGQGFTDVAFDFGASAQNGGDADAAEPTATASVPSHAGEGDTPPGGAAPAAARGGTASLDLRL